MVGGLSKAVLLGHIARPQPRIQADVADLPPGFSAFRALITPAGRLRLGCLLLVLVASGSR